jgi:hypothetical protein
MARDTIVVTRSARLEGGVSAGEEDNEGADTPADRFANPDDRLGLPLTIGLLTLGLVTRIFQQFVRPLIRGIGLVLATPFRLLSWRDTDHRSPTNTVDKLRRDLAGLPDVMRDDVRAILAAITDDLHGRWQFGPRIPPRAYELGDVHGIRTVRRVRVRGDRRTSEQWLRHNAMTVPGRVAAAVVKASGELVSQSGSREHLLTVLVRHAAEPQRLQANLVGRTRGFVVRQLLLVEDYRPVLAAPTESSAPE